MDERESLIQAILDDPADDARRLVFADWQEEYHNAAHAELIRTQCALARLKRSEAARRKELKAREKALLALPAIKDGLASARFERGFVDEHLIGFDGLGELRDPPAPLDRALTLWLSIGHGEHPEEGVMHRLAARPWLGRLARLHFFESDLRAAPARALAASTNLSRLHSLDFTDSGIPADGIADLALAPGRLERLSLAGWFITGASARPIRTPDHRGVNRAIRRIAASPRAACLNWIYVEAIGVGTEGAEAILRSPHLPRLTDLFLAAAHVVSPATRRALRGRFGAGVHFTGADGSSIT